MTEKLGEFLMAWPNHYGWAWMLVGLTGWVVIVIAKEAGR